MIDIGRFMDDGVGVKVKSVDTEYFYSTTTTTTITTTKDIVDYIVAIALDDLNYLTHLFSVDKNGVKTVYYKDPSGVSGDFIQTDSRTITVGAPTNMPVQYIRRQVWVTVEG